VSGNRVHPHIRPVFGVRHADNILLAARGTYAFDGLLENNTILRLREHYTGTHGFTEHSLDCVICWAIPLCRGCAIWPISTFIRWTARLITDANGTLVRVAALLKNRTAPANVIVQRLANPSLSDRLAGALTALGRIVKTIFVLRYLSDSQLRYRVQLRLNRGEARHELVGRCLFFANRGEFRNGDAEEIMNKASSLSLLSNAVLVWNTLRISEIVNQLRAAGHAIANQELARVSPLMHTHVIRLNV
jgi:TnpA family transposase